MILLECTVAIHDDVRKKLQEQLAAEIGQPVVLLPAYREQKNGISYFFATERRARNASIQRAGIRRSWNTPEISRLLGLRSARTACG